MFPARSSWAAIYFAIRAHFRRRVVGPRPRSPAPQPRTKRKHIEDALPFLATSASIFIDLIIGAIDWMAASVSVSLPLARDSLRLSALLEALEALLPTRKGTELRQLICVSLRTKRLTKHEFQSAVAHILGSDGVLVLQSVCRDTLAQPQISPMRDLQRRSMLLKQRRSMLQQQLRRAR